MMRESLPFLFAILLCFAPAAWSEDFLDDGRPFDAVPGEPVVEEAPVAPMLFGEIEPQDAVVADDQIVTGSQCIGFDCLTDDTENFGFDTLKLKENNLQIFFDDTSTTAGFPANDWRITANDSASGGANYFAVWDATAGIVPFRIEAGAGADSLYVSASENVGLGTPSPALRLHLLDDDSPGVRLEQAGGIWTPQTWDIAGNESNFFIRDVTGGSTLPFRIQPVAPTNTLTLKNDGKVGMGTWSPGYALHIQKTGENAAVVVDRTDGASNYINATADYGNFGTVNNKPLRLMVNGSWRARLNTDNSISFVNGAALSPGGVWTNASSRDLKEGIAPLAADAALAALDGLTPVTYAYTADPTDTRVGFVAEEVPELVAEPDRKGLSPMDVVAVLTRVVQEQRETMEQQQRTIEELNDRLGRLEENHRTR